VSAEPLGIAETGRHSRVRGDGFSWRTIAKIDALAMEIRAAGESSRRLKSMRSTTKPLKSTPVP
jgi:hypothetical protein